ncbi:hypothetical protein BKA67DRAFT_410087 [Truncatella angustata]|uniref:Uncharacterized protein n=1 Tax=Truncatella angustata TaxID=152316 RepID=A0A9P8UE26_9PEZI|nr:uncharacterized protein BKA67DRAFT_410087 [Truncatella angustata]KAH6648216.1 hypothetical protein BKA67DRAFT_410087 [Truncatella angustata]
MSLNQSGWLEVNFMCSSCNQWATKDLQSSMQPRVWATDPNQRFKDLSEESTIRKHGYYGYFNLVMSEDLINSETPTTPLIDPSIHNQHDSQTESPVPSSSLFAFHGALLAVSRMVIYPSGVIAIRRQSQTSFSTHLYFQVLATIGCPCRLHIGYPWYYPD